MTGTLVYAGQVGVPGTGEKKCRTCAGTGLDRHLVGVTPFNGCDKCDGTGVVKLRVRRSSGSGK